jgi:PAS domain S-box-containing protein
MAKTNENQPELTRDGELPASQGDLQRQIEDLRAAQAAAQVLADKYRNLLDSVDVGISLVDPAYNILAVNRKQAEIIGLSPAELLGRKCYCQYEGQPDVCPHCPGAKAMSSGIPAEQDVLGRRADGRAFAVHLKASPLFDSGGELRGFVEVVEDITQRKQAEERYRREREMTLELLRLLNDDNDTQSLVRSVTGFLQKWTGCEAIGIRLRQGDDFPYYETRGFPPEFVLAENQLCQRDAAGELVRDFEGNPVVECMCGNVLCGRFNPALPFFTAKGSFWTNATSELLASTSETDRQIHTRNRCNGEGYESVALIALRHGAQSFGLLQINDRAKGRFTAELIAFLENSADQIALGLAQRHTRGAIRESEERYRSLFANMLNGFAYCRMLFDGPRPHDFIYLAVNHAFETTTGLKNVVGKKISEVIPGLRESDPELLEIYGRVALTGVPERFEMYITALDMWFAVSVFSPGKEHFVAVFDVITQRKQMEQRQARSLKRLESVNRLQADLLQSGTLEEKFKQIADTAVALLDLDFCRIWMVKTGDLCNLGCRHAEPGDGRAECPRDRCLHLMASSGRYTHTNGDHRRVPMGFSKVGRIASGEEKDFLTNSVTTDPQVADHQWARRLGLAAFAGYKLHDAHDGAIGVLAAFSRQAILAEDHAFLSNLAETTSKVILESQAETKYREAQKMEVVGQLAGGIAHEFNNLLQVISGYTDFASKGLLPNDPRRDDLGQVVAAAERATNLTRQLLGFSRRQTIRPREVTPNEIMADLLKLVRPILGEQILLETQLGENVGPVWADPGELQQVLLNLCVNARDALPPGGQLRLATDSILLNVHSLDSRFSIGPGRYAVFIVADNGCGMTSAVRERIFEPFFTTKAVGKGTGLGLAVAYGIVQQHKGAIRVDSEPGKGTTFRVYLPMLEKTAAAKAEAKPPPAPAGKGETILFAEDEPLVRQFVGHVLRRAGYTVLEAQDGEEALRLLGRHQGTIALALLDMVMPKIGGYEVFQQIKARYPAVKVVFCSGYSSETARIVGTERLPLLEKPFRSDQLLRTLRDALDDRHFN